MVKVCIFHPGGKMKAVQTCIYKLKPNVDEKLRRVRCVKVCVNLYWSHEAKTAKAISLKE